MNTPLDPPKGVPAWAWDKIARPYRGRWAISERDASGDIIGTAYRLPDGSKGFRAGSKRGLIAAWPLADYAGSSATDPVFVCEGASDTGAMLGLSFDAIGTPATGRCADMLAEVLARRHVVIVADADEAGRKGAREIAAALVARCESVRIIEPPCGEKDARDAIIAGANRAAFEALAAAAPLLDAAALAPVNSNNTPGDGKPILVCMADVEARPVSWLWEGRLPRGRLCLLVGRPGEGKSMGTMDWAARVSTGRDWPDGSTCTPGSVVLVSGEDDPHEVIRPRLEAHGANLNRVHLLPTVVRVVSKGRATEAPFTLADLAPLETALAEAPDCALIVIDPIGSFIGGNVDAHRENEVRGVLAPLAEVARRTGATVLLVAHQRKGAASHADDLVLGSRAFTGIARSVLHLMLDPDDKERRLLLPGKMNLSRPAPTLAFTIEGEPARVVWEPDPVDVTTDAVLAAHATVDTKRSRGGAVDWLRGYLAGGPKLAPHVFAAGKGAGFSESTLKRAKKAAGVETWKEGFSGGWVWGLEGSAAAEGAQAINSDTLRENPGTSTENAPKGVNPGNVAPLAPGYSEEIPARP